MDRKFLCKFCNTFKGYKMVKRQLDPKTAQSRPAAESSSFLIFMDIAKK